MAIENRDEALSEVVIALFKGVIYQENNETLWEKLLQLQNEVKDYVRVLHLELVLNEADSYAFLKTKEAEEDNPFPKLIAKRSLSFDVTLLLALLRKGLVEFDQNNTDTRFILSLSQLIDLMKVHLGESTNQAKLADRIEATVNKVVELGFLQKLKSQQNEPHFEVKRILKSFIDVAWLQQFDQWLSECLENQKGDK